MVWVWSGFRDGMVLVQSGYGVGTEQVCTVLVWSWYGVGMKWVQCQYSYHNYNSILNYEILQLILSFMINNKNIYMIDHLGLLCISHIHTHTHTVCVPNVTLTSIEFSHGRSIKLTFNSLLHSSTQYINNRFSQLFQS